MLLLGRYAKGMNLFGWPLARAALLADLGVTEEGGSMANLLDATIIADRGNTIVELHGDIDIASRPELRKLFDDLGDQENERILVSLAQCTYCDSTVLNALVALKKRVTSRLRVVVPNGSPIRRIFDVTGLSNHFGLLRIGR